MIKIKSILLVDDDIPTNFLHERLIKDLTKKVYVARTGLEAIEFLQTTINGHYPSPTVIFLDINMPVMNGWEFLEKYEELPEAQKANTVIIMLTTSLNIDDQLRAKKIPAVEGFVTKPLSTEKLKMLFLDFFK